ncbi:hypothetical protein PAPYR_7019 [Paratrimastix pyriformis]|uniref:Uncharacterized protein n=1 Tax=Paratrimastix pyriformis TaxID=342808 RepID=A0ABQ8UE68_9EUKA|nr:hypothetical protein PAPYR_7019 [Paratrimastix pyriformis]
MKPPEFPDGACFAHGANLNCLDPSDQLRPRHFCPETEQFFPITVCILALFLLALIASRPLLPSRSVVNRMPAALVRGKSTALFFLRLPSDHRVVTPGASSCLGACSHRTPLYDTFDLFAVVTTAASKQRFSARLFMLSLSEITPCC